MDRRVRERYNFTDLPSLAELEKKTEIALVNSDPVVDYSEPLPLKVIQVGGLQIKEPKTLPQVIKFYSNN